MGKLFKLTTALVLIGIVVFFARKCCHKKVDLSSYRDDGWFGKQSVTGKSIPKDPTEIRSFQINVPDTELADLKLRLERARFVDHIEGTSFQYGFNSNYLKQVVEYWRTKFDWKREEAKLNSVPHFKTQIEGLDIHFVRAKPSKPAKKVVPILVIHGWPGSFVEYMKSIPLLTEPDTNGMAFEVIAPSIPGYGYSEAPHQKGFNIISAARVFVKLMKRLGHDKFVVHGGDWGNMISRTIATVYPEHITGLHLLANWDALSPDTSFCQLTKMALAAYFPSLFFDSATRDHEYGKLYPFGEKFLNIIKESGYMHIQATKPDTVAAGLNDSPVGLAAYILEKFSTWTNLNNIDKDNGGLTEKFTLDELLTNVMVYWTSGNIASSQRFYKENFSVQNDVTKVKVTVPSGTVDYPHELVRAPRKFIEHNYHNLVQYTDLPRGGHFLAFEEPRLVSDNIRQFVAKVFEQERQQADDEAKKQQNAKHDEV